MLDDLCDVHNHFLKLEQRYYRIYGKYAGRYRLQPHLTKLLKRTKKHWAWIPRDTLDAVIIRLDTTYQRFFKGLGGLPKFKRKDRYRSAKFQTGYKLTDGGGLVCLSSLGTQRNKNLYLTAETSCITTIAIGKETSAISKSFAMLWATYWLYVVTDDSTTEPYLATGESVGIDFGIDTYLTLNTGEKIQSPQFLKQSLTELRHLNKALSRKQKGSGNWWRAVRDLARLYRKVANQSRDWHWKLATDLCKRFDTLILETLNLDGMKRLWGRKVSDLCGFWRGWLAHHGGQSLYTEEV